MSKKPRKGALEDPHAAREAQRYENPIPSREAIVNLLEGRGELMKRRHIADALKLHSDQDMEALRRRLHAMVRDGQLIKNRRGGYGIAAKLDLIPGRVIGHADGFGFLTPDKGGEDLYLSSKQMRRVLHGDRVLGQILNRDRRGLEGAIVEILERAHSHLVGRYFEESGVSFVVADEKRISQDILIPSDADGGATHGDYVYLEIIEQPGHRRQPTGRVLNVLGRSINAPMAAEVAIRNYDLPHEWPRSTITAAKAVPDHVTEADLAGRKDLRQLPLVTIDGADARDFDDAVYAEATESGGWKVWVAIADVSHYVKRDAPMDVEARKRGTSVYFPNRVIPMLPERLSNGVCSLNPQVDRLCMVCEMRYDATAKIERSHFYPAVMHSHARFTYDQVWQYLDRGEGEVSPPVSTSLRHLHAVFRALLQRRKQRGAIEFDSREVAFQFDASGEVENIVARHRNDAHRLIEECMIAANVEAAKFLQQKKIPAPYRVHARPPEKKFEDLRLALAELGLSLPLLEKLKPAHVAQLLASVTERPDAALIQALVLRSQSLAVYQTDNNGHFGLALDAYAHFTSPIRRYPDLMVHRAIRHAVAGGTAADFEFKHDEVVRIAAHASTTERRAEEAARDVDDRLKCAYMQSHVGDEFEGTVGGVMGFGLFVDLVGLNVSGLVHITMLPNDYYHFDPVAHTLSGERRGRVFRLADPVRVEVIRVDVDEREIDLKIVK